MTTEERDHGVGLVERVIDGLAADPGHAKRGTKPLLTGRPDPMAPDVLGGLTFPSGRTLSPSLRRWLEFDTSLLTQSGWFASGTHAALAPRRLNEIATAEWGSEWGDLYAPMAERFGECFLLPGGTDSRRLLATGDTDEFGEYPVLGLDIDDMPFVGLMYPGFDVYLADRFGLIDIHFTGYDELVNDPLYGDRMRQHAGNWFAGRTAAEYPW
jgi:hypothetical protein